MQQGMRSYMYMQSCPQTHLQGGKGSGELGQNRNYHAPMSYRSQVWLRHMTNLLQECNITILAVQLQKFPDQLHSICTADCDHMQTQPQRPIRSKLYSAYGLIGVHHRTKNRRFSRSSLDPFLSSRVGSENETNAKQAPLFVKINLYRQLPY